MRALTSGPASRSLSGLSAGLRAVVQEIELHHDGSAARYFSLRSFILMMASELEIADNEDI